MSAGLRSQERNMSVWLQIPNKHVLNSHWIHIFNTELFQITEFNSAQWSHFNILSKFYIFFWVNEVQVRGNNRAWRGTITQHFALGTLDSWWRTNTLKLESDMKDFLRHNSLSKLYICLPFILLLSFSCKASCKLHYSPTRRGNTGV